MKIISCENCAVLLDQDSISVTDRENEDGSVNEQNMGWDGSSYVPKIKCPVCREDILLEGFVDGAF